jgi:hypothetical protein
MNNEQWSTKSACDFANVQVAFMTAIQFSYEPSILPTSFNAEDKWGGGLISGVEDQAGPQPAPQHRVKVFFSLRRSLQ